MQSSIWISIHTAISIFILLGLFWALYIGNEGVALNDELRSEQAALQVQLENLMDQNRNLENQIREMQNSDLYIEAFARSKLGLVKQGEEFIPNKDLQSNETN